MHRCIGWWCTENRLWWWNQVEDNRCGLDKWTSVDVKRHISDRLGEGQIGGLIAPNLRLARAKMHRPLRPPNAQMSRRVRARATYPAEKLEGSKRRRYCHSGSRRGAQS